MLTEYQIQRKIAQYLNDRHPGLIWTSDLAGHLPHSAKLWALRKRNWPIPDLLIFEPRLPYFGLFLELKRTRAEVWNKDGSPKKDEHILQQFQALYKLTELGYYANFGYGYEDSIDKIQTYLEKGEFLESLSGEVLSSIQSLLSNRMGTGEANKQIPWV